MIMYSFVKNVDRELLKTFGKNLQKKGRNR